MLSETDVLEPLSLSGVFAMTWSLTIAIFVELPGLSTDRKDPFQD